jgi:3-oxoacyl-(acyl-carrier-protein) synthase
MPIAPAIRGLGCLSCLGDGVNDHLRAIDSQTSGLRPLRELQPDFPDIHAGWIKPRSLLSNRRWAPASMAALHVTAEAILDAGWQNDDLSDVPVFASGSRGNLAGWLEPWQDRRPLGLFAASNSIACEPAAAICHHHRIRAPWHFSASGCCAGLDALIDAALHLRVGRARRAIVVAVDLPLVSPVLDAFARTGMFGDSNTPGMQPAEAAAAICLDLEETPGVRITDDISGNDPDARFGGNRPLPVLKEILSRLLAAHPTPTCCIPHSSGTPSHAVHENSVLDEVLHPSTSRMPLKPLTGHALGASALLETVLGVAILRNSPPTGSILKIASALGGKHSIALLTAPS